MVRLAKVVSQHLEKARSSALTAVENYNKPGIGFRTRTYTILMVIAWTALFHAVYYRRRLKPWHVRAGTGRGTRYVHIDGEPKHWELGECIKQYWGDQNPPERNNLEFLLQLRHKIEHRDHPELDPALYGECQAMLMNFEDLLVREFGQDSAIAGDFGIALQFSSIRPTQQEKALRRLAASGARDVLDFVEAFRAGLPPEVLDSTKYALRLFLVPKLANRESAADLAVEFVPYDASKPGEMVKLQKVTAMIREKQVPVASKDLLKAGEVLARLKELLPFRATMHTHIKAWKYYKVRPLAGSQRPEQTNGQFCIYDHLMQGYGYTAAWVTFLLRELSDPGRYQAVTGQKPEVPER